jgi:LL-diaminopimelate aminotransferase
MKRNKHLAKLKRGYLFPEIGKRKREFLEKNPDVNLISLGIGDTTEPIPPSISRAMSKAALQLGEETTYSGYGPEQGREDLRQQIAAVLYNNQVKPSEVFVSDGAKCDIGRLQLLMGDDIAVGIQDPAYPVYVDGTIMHGVTSIHFMACTPHNRFFPDISQLPPLEVIYFCSPNNPTGAVATRPQLEELVDYARRNKSILLFDTAYAAYIQDPTLPRSIFEIPGAREVAIETSSFSKIAGFTGVRLGWTVVPEELKYEDGSYVKADWNRIMTTLFNGASNIAQAGGLAILQPQGQQETTALARFYMENAQIIKSALTGLGLTVYGGDNAPYLWVDFKGRNSWEVFQELLEECHLVATPGSGFGPAGEGFMRFSAFGHREQVLEAADRLKAFSLIA